MTARDQASRGIVRAIVSPRSRANLRRRRRRLSGGRALFIVFISARLRAARGTYLAGRIPRDARREPLPVLGMLPAASCRKFSPQSARARVRTLCRREKWRNRSRNSQRRAARLSAPRKRESIPRRFFILLVIPFRESRADSRP
jgi:hypothetical protein